MSSSSIKNFVFIIIHPLSIKKPPFGGLCSNGTKFLFHAKTSLQKDLSPHI
jgi:hypothetical protein